MTLTNLTSIALRAFPCTSAGALVTPLAGALADQEPIEAHFSSENGG